MQNNEEKKRKRAEDHDRRDPPADNPAHSESTESSIKEGSSLATSNFDGSLVTIPTQIDDSPKHELNVPADSVFSFTSDPSQATQATPTEVSIAALNAPEVVAMLLKEQAEQAARNFAFLGPDQHTQQQQPVDGPEELTAAVVTEAASVAKKVGRKRGPRKQKAKAEGTEADAAEGSTSSGTVGGKWMSTNKLDSLGVAYRKGKFDELEERQLKEAMKLYVAEHNLSEEQLQTELFRAKDKKDVGGGKRQYAQSAFWTEMSKYLPERPVQAIYHFLRRKFHQGNYAGRWSPEEDALLVQYHTVYGDAWERIAEHIGRPGTACRDRFQKDLQATTKGPWTREEVDLLYNALRGSQSGGKKLPWAVVAEQVGTRTAQQCRLKFQKDTTEKTELWSRSDDQALMQALIDSQITLEDDVMWTEIAAGQFPDRTGNDLRARFKSLKKPGGYEKEAEFTDSIQRMKSYVDERAIKVGTDKTPRRRQRKKFPIVPYVGELAHKSGGDVDEQKSNLELQQLQEHIQQQAHQHHLQPLTSEEISAATAAAMAAAAAAEHQQQIDAAATQHPPLLEDLMGDSTVPEVHLHHQNVGGSHQSPPHHPDDASLTQLPPHSLLADDEEISRLHQQSLPEPLLTEPHSFTSTNDQQPSPSSRAENKRRKGDKSTCSDRIGQIAVP